MLTLVFTLPYTGVELSTIKALKLILEITSRSLSLHLRPKLILIHNVVSYLNFAVAPKKRCVYKFVSTEK